MEKIVINTKGVLGTTQRVVCTKGKFVGEVGNEHEYESEQWEAVLMGRLSFEECEGNRSKADQCRTHGWGPGMIKIPVGPSNAWGRWLEAGEAKPGLAIFTTYEKWRFECGGEAVELGGLLVGTAINHPTLGSVSIVWKVNSSLEQEDQTYFLGEGESVGVHLYSEPSKAETTFTSRLKIPGVTLGKEPS
jgi:hypothetical protein